jgi:methionyl aminopeptidase
MVTLRSPSEIEKMKQAGRIVVEALKKASKLIEPKISTYKINSVIEECVKSYNAELLFKGYRGFPAGSCISINEEVVHGIPSKKRLLAGGDIVSIDVGVRYRGYCGDAAITFPVKEISESKCRLITACRKALACSIEQMRAGGLLSRVCGAIQDYARSCSYSVVRKFVGHGIGTEMHEPPHVPNYVDREVLANDLLLRPGMVLAIEPMLNEGTYEVRELKDRWTVVTLDGKNSAHYEQTVALGSDGPEILTPWHEEIDIVCN